MSEHEPTPPGDDPDEEVGTIEPPSEPDAEPDEEVGTIEPPSEQGD